MYVLDKILLYEARAEFFKYFVRWAMEFQDRNAFEIY